MHVLKEAQTSSRIEGTQTAIDEALMPVEQIHPEKRDDWQEVQNYIDAVNAAIDALKTLPLSNRLLKQTHTILMKSVRGEHKQPGDFRSSQNWIGGSNLSDAAFIPPHAEGVAELMADLEKFWHNEHIAVPHLIRIAISHYQFETIHPFRASYYDALMQVRVSNNLIHWVRFFLQGIAETATKGRQVFQKILMLRTEVEQQILSLGKRMPNARAALSVLYRQPIISAIDLEKGLDVSTPTANTLIRSFQDLGLLVETTGQLRDRAFVFDRYLKLFVS